MTHPNRLTSGHYSFKLAGGKKQTLFLHTLSFGNPLYLHSQTVDFVLWVDLEIKLLEKDSHEWLPCILALSQGSVAESSLIQICSLLV